MAQVADRLAFKVTGPAGDRVEIMVVETRADGLTFQWGQRGFHVKDEQKLELWVPTRDSKVSKVVATVTKFDDETVECAFVDAAAFHEKASVKVRQRSNRRDAFRVAPDPKAPIEVKIRQGSRRVRAPLRNISALGMGVMLTDDQTLDGVDVQLEFSLPGQEEPVRIDGIVQYGRRIRKGMLVGIAYVLESAEADRAADAVTRYVMERQRRVEDDDE